MFAKLLSALTADQPAPLAEMDARLALAALLVRVARSDGDYAPAEVARINQILIKRYDVSAAEVEEIRTQAEVLESEAPDTVRFTRAIKDAVPYEDRFGVVKALWTVVMADGEREDEEDAQLRLLAKLLGVNDRDSAIARQQAQA